MTLAEAIEQYHNEARAAFMATCEGEFPRVRPMAPARVEGNVIWICTHADSPKMAQLRGNANVELCYMKPDWGHLRLRGEARACRDAERKKDIWEGFPGAHKFFDSPQHPDFALLEFTVAEALHMPAGAGQYEVILP
jgi:uncharacterized pyridoxamine 5'-phosphate oxidase family protein